VKTGAPQPTPSLEEAQARVLGIQTKLHQRATGDPARRFEDLYNLICDPAFLLVAWRRVRGNKGARTAGVDGQTARYIERERGEEVFLADVRADLKARRFTPLPGGSGRSPSRVASCAGWGSRPSRIGWSKPR
jgi:RNA-directed DNA polymerase